MKKPLSIASVTTVTAAVIGIITVIATIVMAAVGFVVATKIHSDDHRNYHTTMPWQEQLTATVQPLPAPCPQI